MYHNGMGWLALFAPLADRKSGNSYEKSTKYNQYYKIDILRSRPPTASDLKFTSTTSQHCQGGSSSMQMRA